jgi:hypothetical protein
MNTVMRRALPLVAALALGGCASGGSGSNGGPFAGRGEPALLEVINHNFNDATIWAVFRAERIRLGTVTGKTSARFQLSPERLFEPVYMEIDLVGGVHCVTDTLTLDEGDELQLEIAIDASSRPECAGVRETAD